MAYKTVLGPSEGEVTEKKSRFLGYLLGVKTEAEAKNIIASIKKAHHQSNHSCSAYRIRGQQLTERYNDDGEPGGTAGMPMLEVLRGADLENVLVVSTRYFGGTKLGTGGLVRAYTQSAQSALAQAKLIEVGLYCRLMVDVDYGLSGKMEYYLNSHQHLLEDVHYSDFVTFSVYVAVDSLEEVQSQLIELTNDACKITKSDPIEAYVLDGKVITGERA